MENIPTRRNYINEAQNQNQFDMLTKLKTQYDYCITEERGGWRKKAERLTETNVLKGPMNYFKYFELHLNSNVYAVTESNFHFVKKDHCDYTGKKGWRNTRWEAGRPLRKLL